VILIDDTGHLASTTSWEELHTFARMIGLRREWFQEHPRHQHYDCTAEWRRRKARECGAVLVPTRVMLRRMYRSGLWVRSLNLDSLDERMMG
jgi:hypothetical protein